MTAQWKVNTFMKTLWTLLIFVLVNIYWYIHTDIRQLFCRMSTLNFFSKDHKEKILFQFWWLFLIKCWLSAVDWLSVPIFSIFKINIVWLIKYKCSYIRLLIRILPLCVVLRNGNINSKYLQIVYKFNTWVDCIWSLVILDWYMDWVIGYWSPGLTTDQCWCSQVKRLIRVTIIGLMFSIFMIIVICRSNKCNVLGSRPQQHLIGNMSQSIQPLNNLNLQSND